MRSIFALFLNLIPICYFIIFMIGGIVDQFQPGDPASKIFFFTSFNEIMLLIIFCLFLPILNMRLIYENYNNIS